MRGILYSPTPGPIHRHLYISAVLIAAPGIRRPAFYITLWPIQFAGGTNWGRGAVALGSVPYFCEHIYVYVCYTLCYVEVSAISASCLIAYNGCQFRPTGQCRQLHGVHHFDAKNRYFLCQLYRTMCPKSPPLIRAILQHPKRRQSPSPSILWPLGPFSRSPAKSTR